MFNINVNFIYFNVKQLYMDSKAVLLMLVLGVLLIAPYALAVPGGASVQGSADDKGSYTSSPGSIDVYAGHVHLANVTGEQSTYHWAGVYGNATGTLVLGDGSSHKMFEWNANAQVVFFSDASLITWGSLAAADPSNFDNDKSLTSASDSASKTFTNTGGTLALYSLPDVTNTYYALTYDNTQTGVWKTHLLTDGSAYIFAGEVNSGGTAYNGDTADYQVILYENGEDNDANPTTYNIWIELY